MNWAEYLSYIQPRLRSYDQYLLVDPANGRVRQRAGAGERQAPGNVRRLRDAPSTCPPRLANRASSLVVWGAARAASTTFRRHAEPPTTHYRWPTRPRQLQIQFQARLGQIVPDAADGQLTNPRGYFDVKQAFTRSGTVRLAWSSRARHHGLQPHRDGDDQVAAAGGGPSPAGGVPPSPPSSPPSLQCRSRRPRSRHRRRRRACVRRARSRRRRPGSRSG